MTHAELPACLCRPYMRSADRAECTSPTLMKPAAGVTVENCIACAMRFCKNPPTQEPPKRRGIDPNKPRVSINDQIAKRKH